MKKDIRITNKKVTVLGMARSGIGAAVLLKKFNNSIFVSDISKTINSRTINRLKKNNIEFETGKHTLKKILKSDIVILSPGISHKSELVRNIKNKKIEVISELELGYRFFNKPVIAVTGTNGKTTVTTLIGKILTDNGFNPVIAGNIGVSFSEKIINKNSYGPGVIEVSSFQLDSIKYFKPYISVITNLSPDHLDRYSSLNEYYKSKKNIFKNQNPSDYAVLNRSDCSLFKLTKKIKANKLYFNDKKNIFYSNNFIKYQNRNKITHLVNVRKLKIFGKHNYENIMAAYLACRIFNIKDKDIISSIVDFEGVEHRLEHVADIAGRSFYNDSKSTNIESLKKSLESFKDKVILIAGGRDKNSDFSSIKKIVKNKVKTLLLIGEAKDKMAEQLQSKNFIKLKTLKESVQTAFNISSVNDNILLSPACASFDMFKNFEDRGKKFKRLVTKLQDGYKKIKF